MGRWLGWLLLGSGVASLVALGLLFRPPRLAVPSQGLILADVTLVNPGRERLEGRTLSVFGGRIGRIAPHAAGEVSGPWAGATVLPGLVDLHVHHPPAWALGERELFASLFLAHGVTTVRDTGTVWGSLEGHAGRIAEGRLAGPRVFHCGSILDGEPPVWPSARVVPDAAEARRAVEELIAQGASCVKLYNRLSPAALDAIRSEAEARGLPIVAHVPDASSLVEMKGGEVQHLTGLTPNWWRVTGERLTWYAETSRTHAIAHTPTLVAFDRHVRLSDYDALATDPAARWLPTYYREILWNPLHNRVALEISPTGGSTVANRIPVMQRLVGELARRGVPVRVGTDTGSPFVVPGASLHDELSLLFQAGLSAEDVWEAATRGGGEALGVPGLGVLQEGAPADLLVFRGDPTRDLSAMATLEAVVADGRLYRVDDLQAALKRQQAYFERPLVDRLSRWAARAVLGWLAWSREH